MSYDYGTWNGGWYATATEDQRAEFRDWMRAVLRNERVNIRFIKADGTERWLHCTLHPALMPMAESTDPALRRPSETAQSVWDIDKQAWRSFRWDSIREFSFNLGDLYVDV